jgi:hypothetical protein
VKLDIPKFIKGTFKSGIVYMLTERNKNDFNIFPGEFHFNLEYVFCGFFELTGGDSSNSSMKLKM